MNVCYSQKDLGRKNGVLASRHMWTGYHELSESWHSSTTLKNIKIRKSVNEKENTENTAFINIRFPQHRPCRQNQRHHSQLRLQERCSDLGGGRAGNSNSGTEVVLCFQILIFKIQDWLVESDWRYIRYFPTQSLFPFSHHLPPFMTPHPFSYAIISSPPIWNKLV